MAWVYTSSYAVVVLPTYACGSVNIRVFSSPQTIKGVHLVVFPSGSQDGKISPACSFNNYKVWSSTIGSQDSRVGTSLVFGRKPLNTDKVYSSRWGVRSCVAINYFPIKIIIIPRLKSHTTTFVKNDRRAVRLPVFMKVLQM